ncbi:MAG: hypothetical protein LBU19_03910 [Treponema sp.]|jgi:hypothetical protein|nr:hypothetical protein [Treponema sp.]
MKKQFVISAVLLLVVTAFAAAGKYAPPSAKSLSGELQWLTIQTACTGQYSMAQTGDFTQALRINPSDAFVRDSLEDARRG